MSPILVAILLLIIAYKFYEFLTCVPPNTPPCLPRLPLIGSYWHLLWGNYKFPHKTVPYYINKLKSKLLTCYFGGFLAVIASDYESIKEILTREEFDGRANDIDVIKARSYGKKLGIFFTDGSFWKEQRRFTLRHMRDFGFGRRHDKFETDMMEEIAMLVKMLREGPINDEEKAYLKHGYALFPDVLFPYSGNSIWDIMFGDRFDRSQHHKMKYFCQSAMIFQRAGETTGGTIVVYGFLKYFGDMFNYKSLMEGNYRMANFLKKYVIKRKQSDYHDIDRGFVDRYLKELKKYDHVMSTFSEEQLIIALVDVMFPALSAMPSVVVHSLKLVLHHPNVLRKVQEEIDRVVGTGRYVTWDDRKDLPYTEATIRETLRYETLTPFSIFHRATKDTTLCGYNVPKGTFTITNLDGLNHDPDLWGDPENFRPERFLKEDGQLGKDFTLPFGLGHRVCAGETFARYNVFSVFAALIQNFNFSFVEGQPTSLQDKMPGFITTPKEIWVKVEPRR